MSARTQQRLRRIEAIWSESTSTPSEDAIDHLRFWSRPVVPVELRRFLASRGDRRDEPFTAVEEEQLARRLLFSFQTADLHRANRLAPLWRRVWPEWKPNMTLGEHLAFDDLLSRHGEARVAHS